MKHITPSLRFFSVTQQSATYRPTVWLRSIAIASAIALGSATFTPPMLAQEMMKRVLSVTGQGKEMIAATQAQVNLAVEAEGKTADEAQQTVAQRSDAVVKFLKSQRVEKLQTTGINLSPNYSYTAGKRRLIGYRASNSVRFKVSADQAGVLLDRAVKAGATRINGLSFSATDSAIAAAQKEALRSATQDAQEQANAVLSALSFSSQEIVGIQVNQAAPPPVPVPFARTATLESDAAPSTPVVAGEQTVQASVTLQIRY